MATSAAPIRAASLTPSQLPGQVTPSGMIPINPNTGQRYTYGDFLNYNQTAAPGDTNNASDAAQQYQQYLSGQMNQNIVSRGANSPAWTNIFGNAKMPTVPQTSMPGRTVAPPPGYAPNPFQTGGQQPTTASPSALAQQGAVANALRGGTQGAGGANPFAWNPNAWAPQPGQQLFGGAQSQGLAPWMGGQPIVNAPRVLQAPPPGQMIPIPGAAGAMGGGTGTPNG